MFTTDRELLTLREVAEELGLHYMTIYRYCFECKDCKQSLKNCTCGAKNHVFSPINVGGSDENFKHEWRIPKSQIEAFLQSRRY